MLFRDKDDVILANNSFYKNIDPRRRQEVADSRMIQEDHKAMANLPKEGFQRQFNPSRFNGSNWFDDEVVGR